MVNRRSLFKSLIAAPILILSEKSGLGDEMTDKRRTFTINKAPGSSFSTIVDSNLNVQQFREHDTTSAPFIRLWSKDSEQEFFSIEVSCFKILDNFYVDAFCMGYGMAAVWEGEDILYKKIEFDFSYANIIYKEGYEERKNALIHIFKNFDSFVAFCVSYKDQKNYEQKYKPYVDKLIGNFVFENSRDNASQVEIVKLDSRSTILLPFDWKYRDITKNVRKDYDPKNTLTNAYFFENKLRPKNSLPVIGLAHYQDDIEEARYLLNVYKDAIVKDYTKDRQKTIFDDAEIITLRDDDGKITTQSLVIKLRVPEMQSLPMNVRAVLFRSSITQGCYILYTTTAIVLDSRIKKIKDFNIAAEWMFIDVMGTSMERLLAHALRDGLNDYPRMFHYVPPPL